VTDKVRNSKYDRYAIDNPLPDVDTAWKEIKQAWLRALLALGCARVVSG
jgi:hypothetical protein